MSVFEATLNDREYPRILIDRLHINAPAFVSLRGNIRLLNRISDSWAIVGSVKFDDEQIVHKYLEFVKFLAKNHILVVSGFHSPIEKMALSVIAVNDGVAIQVQARSLHKMRVFRHLKSIYDGGNMLFVSATSTSAHRASLELTQKRNTIACAMAENILVLSQNPESKTMLLATQLLNTGRNVYILGNNASELYSNFDKE